MTTQALSAPLADLAHHYGVACEYWDWQGNHVTVDAGTIRAVLRALGVDASDDVLARRALRDAEDQPWRDRVPPFTVQRAGRAGRVRVHVPHGDPVHVWVDLENWGGRRELTQLQVWVDPHDVDGALTGAATFELPADLPLGWHTLCAQIPEHDVHTGVLVVAPDRLQIPRAVADSGAWGLMTQLYSVRSRNSWGVGDLADLAETVVWSARDLGADFTLINPVHAAQCAIPMEASPYLPTSRRFVNPLYIRIEDIPEVAYLQASARKQVERIAQRARAGNTSERIDRDTSWTAKKEALRIIYRHPRSPRRQSAFEAFCEREGQGLLDFATWCVLSEKVIGAWPEELHDARSAQVAALREKHHEDVVFVMWCQWIVDAQLAAVQREAKDAGMSLGIVTDLAVGVHPFGADAWALRDALARGMSVGAPPDPYNQMGQDWSQPPWQPDRLARLGYAPYRDMIRAALRHCGALRIDHIIGLFRLWWVPQGRPALEGTYVRYDHEALIGILALEAHRAGAVIVGEDLGTVEPWVRDYLAGRGILGTSILWFEQTEHGPRRPEDYRSLCLASVTTHDLPPTAGYLTGEHLRVRAELGLFTRPVETERAEDEAQRARMLTALGERGLLAGLPAGSKIGPHSGSPGGSPGGPHEGAPAGLPADPQWSEHFVETHLEGIVEALYRYLSFTPACLLGVAVPDLVGDRRAMNQPGTSDEYPNWRLPLAAPDGTPVSLEELIASRWARRLARCVHRGRRR